MFNNLNTKKLHLFQAPQEYLLSDNDDELDEDNLFFGLESRNGLEPRKFPKKFKTVFFEFSEEGQFSDAEEE